MTAATGIRKTDPYRLVALAGVAVAVVALFANFEFLFDAGTDDVLRGLAYSGFVLLWMLVLTAGSRTVSVATLGIYFLLGVWAVTGLGYLIEDGVIDAVGGERTDGWVPTWLASFAEEGLKTLAVVAFYVLATRDGRRWPSITDGMLVGLVVGAGLKFHEDAHIGIVTGHGWGSAPPLSTALPTIEAYGDYLYNDHAVRGALEGLGIGAAAMFWHRKPARWFAAAGVLLMFFGHVMWNHFVTHSSEDVPFFYATLRDLLDRGSVPLYALLAGAVAATVAELMILRWVGERDRWLPPLPVARLRELARGWNTRAGAAQLLAAERYVTLRRSVYYAGWRARQAGGYPEVNQADFAELASLSARLGIRQPAAAQAPQERADGGGTPETEAAAVTLSDLSEAD